MIADSFLGAGLERRRLVNNDSVNFLGTLIAAALPSGWPEFTCRFRVLPRQVMY